MVSFRFGPFLSLALSYAVPSSSVQLEEALLFDMFPPPSEACLSHINNSFANTQTTHTFDHSPSPSYWDAMSEPYEQQNFLAEMTSIDPSDTDLSWKLRIGKSGNMYSLEGAYGEAVPPQYHPNGPFIDEVNQLVAVNQVKNRDSGYPYFIHQAGAYMKDSPYTDNNPFFSPSIAKFCKDRTCVFASWGQQAHLATIHKGVALYYTMYTDCGNGVIEFSQIIHNAADNGDDLSYLNVPWGGPRKSTLRSYVQANSNNGLEHRWPIHDWGNFVENLSSLGGYTVFADKLKLSDAQCQYDLPVVNGESIQLVVANKDSHTAFMSWHTNQWGAYAVRTELQTTGASGAGCRTCYLSLTSAGRTVGIVSRVLHWSWDGRWLYHFPIGKTAAEINGILTKNTEILVTCANDGYEPENSLALAHAYGFQTPGISERFAATRTRYGSTSPGRSYTAFTVNARLFIDPGETYVYRQYFITGKYLSVASKAAQWKDEAYDELLHSGEMVGRDIELYSDSADSFAVTVAPEPCHQGELRCSGKSVPGVGLVPHFFITCGSNSYFGPNQYHFAPDLGPNGEIRAYACKGEDVTVRPTLKLIGYFAVDACAYLENASTVLDSGLFCTESPSSLPSLQPSDSPSKNLSSQPSSSFSSNPTSTLSHSPSKSSTDKPSSAPSNAPSNSPSTLASSTPTITISSSPSDSLSEIPSFLPSSSPSSALSSSPTISLSETPSLSLSSTPSITTSNVPSLSMSTTPSSALSSSPTTSLSETPSLSLSSIPSSTTSNVPSLSMSTTPTFVTTSEPSSTHSSSPSTASVITSNPSAALSSRPTNSPTGDDTNSPSNTLSNVPTSSTEAPSAIASCATIQNGGDCKNTPGCTWQRGECMDIEPTCDSFVVADECKKNGCVWNRGECQDPSDKTSLCEERNAFVRLVLNALGDDDCDFQW